MCEINRYLTEEDMFGQSMLPHHFYDFTTRSIMSFSGDEVSDISIKVHCERILNGIALLNREIAVPSEHPLHNILGDNIWYKDDCGHSLESLQSCFTQYFQGDPDERLWISLQKDSICQSCAFGVHCDAGLERREKKVSGDNLYLESLFTWYDIANILDVVEIFDLMKNQQDANFQLWLARVYEFKEFLLTNQIDFVFDDTGSVIGASMPRGTLTNNLSLICYYFQTPCDKILWRSRKDSKLVDVRDRLGPKFDQIANELDYFMIQKRKVDSYNKEMAFEEE